MNKKAKSKKSTMTDVAKMAGVTIGTVSHVINDTASITTLTKKKVLKAIKALNYKPNSMARGLRRSESKMIGLLVPDITNEYYSLIARSFTDMAYKDGYTVMLCSFQYDLDREQIELDVLVDNSIDAIVVIGGCSDDEKMLLSVKERGIPVILGDRCVINNEYPTVTFDNRQMVKQVIGFLVEKGYRSIGFVTESLTMTNLRSRYDGYIDGLKEHDLAIKQQFIIIDACLQLNKVDNGYTLMKELVNSGSKIELPEVFITTSDLIAIGMIGALKEEGYRVPDDVGFVGYDNLSVSAYLDPALTTVAQSPKMIGSAAWDIMINVLKKENDYTAHLVLQQDLVVRNSV